MLRKSYHKFNYFLDNWHRKMKISCKEAFWKSGKQHVVCTLFLNWNGRFTCMEPELGVSKVKTFPLIVKNMMIMLLQNNLRKTKSLNTNNQKRKKKQVQTNKHWYSRDPYDLFSRGLRRSTKRNKSALISKERKQIWKPNAY